MLSRTWFLFLPLFFLLSLPSLPAQEEAPDEQLPPPIESEWIHESERVYSAGDRTFSISLGMLFPTYFGGEIENNNHNLRLGGTGSLAFNYFLSPNIFVGGEVAGSFSATRGGNMLYMIPFGARVGYQFVFRRFEFPLSVLVGAAPQMKLEERYFGLVVKPGVAAFWRFNPDWSFGLSTVWWFVPQWPKIQEGDNVRRSVYGNFIDLTLSARYHF